MRARWDKSCILEHRFHIFIAVMAVLKITLMGLFSSGYQNSLFMRFIGGFLEQISKGNLINPYEFFRNVPDLFPYPPLMLLFESFGGILSRLSGGNLFLQNVLFKLPNLLFDFLGMYWLMRMFPQKRKHIAILYFASPIVIYSTYMHGQLDIIPTTLLTGALLYLTVPRYRSDLRYVILIAAALACKFHILALLPMLLLFIAKRDGWLRAVVLTLLPCVLVVLVIIPFWGEGFLNNVLLNSEQAVLTRITFDFPNVRIYIPIMAVFLIYMKMFAIGKVNNDLFYSLCGILFSVFLVLIPPMPGWYVPFITIFFIDVRTDQYKNVAIYAALNAAYLLYFLIAHRASYVDLYFLRENLTWMKTENELIVNGTFTLMTSVMLYSIYMMYQFGVLSNSLYQRRNRPFTIGVAGDSASGKSTFTAMAEEIFGRKNLLFIEGDGDHKWERGNAMWEYFTQLNPKSNYLYRQAQDLMKLKNGESIVRMDYDHGTGRFTRQKKIRNRPYILLCGLHALYLPQIRRNLDVKVYMDTDETLRRWWKIRRDTSERGYDKEETLKQIRERREDAERYIYPQKKYADLIVSYFDKSLSDCMEENHTLKLSLKITLDMEIDLEPLIQRVEGYGIGVSYDYDENLRMQSVIFEGGDMEENTIPIADIADEIIPHLDEIIGYPLNVKDNLHGILAVVVLLLVSRRLRGDL